MSSPCGKEIDMSDHTQTLASGNPIQYRPSDVAAHGAEAGIVLGYLRYKAMNEGGDPGSVAARTGLTKDQVNLALGRLMSAGVLTASQWWVVEP